MSIAFQIGLARARVALLAAGLAWLFGLQAPVAIRAAIGGLVIAAVVFDGVVADRSTAQAVIDTKPPPHNDYRPAA
ncbi:hypothetical protein [Streptomyces albireticuli]|uniref:Uncharacterized protein n=1 Tax=Streptomyces albireticuli TaxID=1940 RepID=A0A2A2D294_9ACTN|nr:hypothetical protein [Streptomyces albireticuli]MCD9196057.1 hypothetical protein [Streptomyces albireticuli]PAU46553.1 hypothetical protein CK936_23455 [Streptomyces albireticuli]